MGSAAGFETGPLRAGLLPMKAYLVTTGSLFGLLTVVHVWWVFEESTQLAKDPWYIVITVIAAALSVWAWRLLRVVPRS